MGRAGSNACEPAVGSSDSADRFCLTETVPQHASFARTHEAKGVLHRLAKNCLRVAAADRQIGEEHVKAPVIEGDSGSPVWFNRQDGTAAAAGILSHQRQGFPQQSCFSRLQNVLSEVDVELPVVNRSP